MGSLGKVLKEDRGSMWVLCIFAILILLGCGCLVFAIFFGAR